MESARLRFPLKKRRLTQSSALERVAFRLMPWPYLQVGHVARIEDGPLRGMTGIVIRIKSGLKLVLSVSLLQRSIAVEIDRSWIGAAYPLKPAAHQTGPSSINFSSHRSNQLETA